MAVPPDPSDRLELRSRVPAGLADQPLVEYLAGRFPYHSPTEWRRQIAAGKVRIADRPVAAERLVRAGEVVAWLRSDREPAVDRNVRMLHAEAAFVVVDKPAHLPVHADGPFIRNTLAHLLRHELGHDRARLVHRLDRETSGVVVAPCTRKARQRLAAQFEAGTVSKRYVAVVRGQVEHDFVEDRPIGHCPTSAIGLRRLASSAANDARTAVTRFEVLERGPANTMVTCIPETGRTHQIRAHLEAAGHALLGDPLYGRPDADYLAFVARVKAGGDARDRPPGEPRRQLLHAAELAFDHPTTGQRVTFAADLPAEFREWLLAPSR
ncbi:MAG: RluA family pseudouridine synthase [bacterium]|nr:RluA family pseudouridine synthase [bacterium]